LLHSAQAPPNLEALARECLAIARLSIYTLALALTAQAPALFYLYLYNL